MPQLQQQQQLEQGGDGENPSTEVKQPLPIDGSHSPPPPDTECWQNRLTSEIFLHYDDYLARWQQLRKRQWTCTATGKQNLTYEEALASERKARQAWTRLSEPLQAAALRFVQFSTTSRIIWLVDEVYAHLKDRFVPGERLLYNAGTEPLSTVYARKRSFQHTLLLRLGFREDVEVLEDLGDGTGDPELRSVRIQLLGKDSSTEAIQVVPAHRLSRVRNGLSKELLRKFLRDAATRSMAHGAPWLVKEELAIKYGIPTEMSEEIQKQIEENRLKLKRARHPGSFAAEEEKAKLQKEPPRPELPKVRWPIEDSEIVFFVKPANNLQHATEAVPKPKREFTVPSEMVGDLLFAWNFFYDFAKPLRLSPFSLDDFENALRHSAPPACSLLAETHCALLDLIVKHTAVLRAKLEKQQRQGNAPRRVGGRFAKQVIAIRAAVNQASEEGDGTNGSAQGDDDGEEEQPEEGGEGDDEDEALYIPLPTEEKWWTVAVGPDNFEQIIISYFFSSGRVAELPDLVTILEQLTGKKVVADQNPESLYFGRAFVADGSPWFDEQCDYRRTFSSLSIRYKLALLSVLISDVLHTRPIREYMDKTFDDALEYRKEKRELEQQRKELLESKADLVREESAVVGDVKKQGTSIKKEDSSVADSDVLNDDDNLSEANSDDQNQHERAVRMLQSKLAAISDEDLSRTSRQEKSRLQQQLRLAEDAKRAAELKRFKETARKKAALNKAKMAEKRQLEESLAQLDKREAVVDRELRLLSGGIRGKPLGRDRFWNRYWWFDGHGSGIAGVMELNTVTGHSTRATHYIPYGTGRLWVEGAGKQPHLGEASGGSFRQISKRRKPGDDVFSDPMVNLPNGYMGELARDAIGQNWLAEGEWAYYDSSEEIDALLAWLNPKGVREQALRNTLDKYYDMVAFNLNKRASAISSMMETGREDPVRSRPSTRRKGEVSGPAYMQYTNRWEQKQ